MGLEWLEAGYLMHAAASEGCPRGLAEAFWEKGGWGLDLVAEVRRDWGYVKSCDDSK